jgi:transposase
MVLERDVLLGLCRSDPGAVVAIIVGQDARIRELEARLAELEARLNQNSGNSSRPPSTDVFVGRKSLRRKGERRAGGQTGHLGSTLLQADDPDRIVVHTVSVCSECGMSLEDVPVLGVERRQVHDIPPLKMVVTEHRAVRKQCPCCKQVARAVFPKGVSCPVQYGLNLCALVVYLNVYQLIPYDRIGELFSDVFMHSMSNGTVAKAVGSCHDRLAGVEDRIRGLLKEASVLHTDETGFRVGGVREWVHVVCTSLLTWYGHHRNRGSPATMDMGILPMFKGVLVHDFWKPYFRYECGHALCNAHLIRELRGVSENTGQEWGGRMDLLLHMIKKEVEMARSMSECLSREQITGIESLYSDIIALGMRENPEQSSERVGKRGPLRQSKAKNLLDRCNGYRNEVLAFMHDPRVPFENNQAERDIRMVKVQQKISGTFRSEEGAQWFCRIRGYISTLKKNKQPVLASIINALEGHPYTPQTTQ